MNETMTPTPNICLVCTTIFLQIPHFCTFDSSTEQRTATLRLHGLFKPDCDLEWLLIFDQVIEISLEHSRADDNNVGIKDEVWKPSFHDILHELLHAGAAG